MNIKPLIHTLAVAGLTGLLAISSAQATVTNSTLAAIKDGWNYGDMATWLNNAEEASWNPRNVRSGTHPDRAEGVIYIFPDDGSANTWWDGVTGSPPDEIPDNAVAYVHWELDNGSGEFPGIMAKTDDFAFKTFNCIMASGSEVPTAVGGTTLKACSNAQGSSKRFKLVVLKTGEPIDLVFNTTDQVPLIYNAIEEDHDGDPITNPTPIADGASDGELAPEELIRVYRYIFKWANGTGTDTALVSDKQGQRIQSFEISVGNGDVDNTFIPGLSFDTRTNFYGAMLNRADNKVVDDFYFWDPSEFSTISPSMYSIDNDDRSAYGGFWDDAPAGIYPPLPAVTNIPNTTVIDSGDSITSNYEDIIANQAGSLPSTYAGDLFGNLMYFGVLSEEDYGQLPVGIYIDDDGDPSTEGSIYAWWDGYDFRWGVDGRTRGIYTSNPSDAWTVVNDTDLAYMAYNELDEHATAPFSSPKFEVAYADDMAGLNTDVYLVLDDNYDPTTNPTFTVRLEATAAPAGTDGDWVTNGPPPTLQELRDRLDPPPDDYVPPSDEGGGGGGCTIGTGSAWNITMPAILAALLGYGLLRRRRKH